jgi:hypothetical protein
LKTLNGFEMQIKTFAGTFKVVHIANCIDDANRYMNNNKGSALIDAVVNEDDSLYIVATTEKI